GSTRADSRATRRAGVAGNNTPTCAADARRTGAAVAGRAPVARAGIHAAIGETDQPGVAGLIAIARAAFRPFRAHRAGGRAAAAPARLREHNQGGDRAEAPQAALQQETVEYASNRFKSGSSEPRSGTYSLRVRNGETAHRLPERNRSHPVAPKSAGPAARAYRDPALGTLFAYFPHNKGGGTMTKRNLFLGAAVL